MERQFSFADERREVKEGYRLLWQLMLEELLEWPEAQAKQWSWLLIDKIGDSPFLDHEHEGYYVVPIIIRKVSRDINASGRLRGEVEMAIHRGAPPRTDAVAWRNWLRQVKPEVESILKRHGGSLSVFDPAVDFQRI